MDYLLIVLFVISIVSAILIMTIIVKFLNSKALVKRNVQNQIQLDLTVVTMMYVVLYSSMFIACEIFGPSRSVFKIHLVLWILQCLFNTGFNCIIALQFNQLFNIFSVTILNDLSESTQLILSRFLVFPFGVIIGSGLCFVQAGSCRKTAIYNYFIIDSLRTTNDKYSYMSGITWISYGTIILISQLSIEVKRFALNKADQKADNLALSATKQLQDAVSKVQIQTPIQLGIHNLIPVTKNSGQSPHTRLFQHLKETINTVPRNKVNPEPQRIPILVECKKQKVVKQVSKNIQDHEKVIRASQMINNVDGITDVEVVNEVNQTLNFVYNLKKDQLGNYHRDVLRPNEYAFKTGQGGNICDPITNLQMTLIKLNKKSSREQVLVN
jgi:hypothetical protein